MKTPFPLVCCLLLAHCTGEITAEKEPEKPKPQEFNLGFLKPTLTVIEIDGCEYLFSQNAIPSSNNYAVALCHKGNCKNPDHFKTSPQ